MFLWIIELDTDESMDHILKLLDTHFRESSSVFGQQGKVHLGVVLSE